MYFGVCRLKNIFRNNCTRCFIMEDRELAFRILNNAGVQDGDRVSFFMALQDPTNATYLRLQKAITDPDKPLSVAEVQQVISFLDPRHGVIPLGNQLAHGFTLARAQELSSGTPLVIIVRGLIAFSSGSASIPAAARKTADALERWSCALGKTTPLINKQVFVH